ALNASGIVVQRSPEIPRSHRAIRTPLFTELHELLGSRQVSLSESFCESFPHSVIVDRPDIGPAQIEKKQHLNRPPANSADGGESFNNLIVSHSKKRASRWDGAVDRFCCQIF